MLTPTKHKENLAFLDILPEEKPTMDAIEFGWMGRQALIDFALDHEKVDKLNDEAKHDLIRELAVRFDDLVNDLPY